MHSQILIVVVGVLRAGSCHLSQNNQSTKSEPGAHEARPSNPQPGIHLESPYALLPVLPVDVLVHIDIDVINRRRVSRRAARVAIVAIVAGVVVRVRRHRVPQAGPQPRRWIVVSKIGRISSGRARWRSGIARDGVVGVGVSTVVIGVVIAIVWIACWRRPEVPVGYVVHLLGLGLSLSLSLSARRGPLLVLAHRGAAEEDSLRDLVGRAAV